DQAPQSEVDQPHPVLRSNEDARRFETAMSDADLMRRRKRTGNLDRIAGHFTALQPASLHHAAQRLAFGQLHRHEMDSIHLSERMDASYVGVVEIGDGSGFPLEQLHPSAVGGDSRMQYLDNDFFGGLVIAGLIDDAGGIL